ncbi:MAG: hypothetical protein M0R06_00175 [Sphaerochaeta sp.]|nr:hypothetical protein [Sphaerochaeta sp.]
MKEIIGDALGIAAISWVLTHLVLIALNGRVEIFESNPAILIVEILLTSYSLAFLITRLIKDYKGEK